MVDSNANAFPSTGSNKIKQINKKKFDNFYYDMACLFAPDTMCFHFFKLDMSVVNLCLTYARLVCTRCNSSILELSCNEASHQDKKTDMSVPQNNSSFHTPDFYSEQTHFYIDIL